MMFLQFKNSWQTFTRNHPKFPAFWRAVYKHGIQENMIIEFKVIEPDGKELASNIRVTKSDLELFENLKKMITNQVSLFLAIRVRVFYTLYVSVRRENAALITLPRFKSRIFAVTVRISGIVNCGIQ